MAKKTRAAPIEAASSGESDSESSSDDDSSVRVEENDQNVDQRKLSSKKRKTNEESENESDSDDSDNDDSDNDADSDADSSDDDSENEEVEGKDEEGDYDEERVSDYDRKTSDDVVLPLHERLKLKEDQGLSLRGVRARKSRALEVASQRLAKFNNQKADDDDDDETQSKKKKSKHAPTEVSSKRSDFFKRGAINLNESGIGVEIGAHRYKPMDPRVSSLSGHLNEEQFEQNFAFVEEMRNKEIAQLKKQIQARKVSGQKGQKRRKRLKMSGGSLEEDQEKLHAMVGEKSEIQRRKINRAAKQSVKKKMRDEVADGTRGAYFLKRKEKKRMELEAKFEVIRDTGGDKAVEKMLAKKRSKNKSRDAGMMGKK
jgi:ribosomal RNA-processing protein 36